MDASSDCGAASTGWVLFVWALGSAVAGLSNTMRGKTLVRRSRSNPRRPEDLDQPWDVSVPLEDLPSHVAAACRAAQAEGLVAWAGAWSPSRPGRTAYVAWMEEKPSESMEDLLTEAGFLRVVKERRWVWRAEGKRLGSPKDLAAPRGRSVGQQAAWLEELNPVSMLRWLMQRNRRLGVLGACVCARWALRWVPVDEKRPLRAIETAEAWVRKEATAEQARAAAHTAWAYYRIAASTSNSAAYAAYAAYQSAAATEYNSADYMGQAASAAANACDAAAFESTAGTDEHGASYFDRVSELARWELCDVIRFRVDPFARRVR